MALACELCGKKPSFGNTISHAHNVTPPPLESESAPRETVIKGASKHIRVCTACIRSGRVKKAA